MNEEELNSELAKLNQWTKLLIITGATVSVLGALLSLLRLYKEQKQSELEMRMRYER